MSNLVELPRVCIVGPLPPPSGGMANQCRQLLELLCLEGVRVAHVQTNSPYRPAWIGRLRGVRALFRLVPYVGMLWRTLGRVDVVHLFANSGWSWYFFAVPALTLARLRRVPVIVNYRGGQAAEFLAHAPGFVPRALQGASAVITPSAFLQRVFGGHGIQADIIPNVVDLSRFSPSGRSRDPAAPHLIVTRNLEPIYDIATALRAFAVVRRSCNGARLTVAGSGPELDTLQRLTRELGIASAVNFCGRIDNAEIGHLYADADLMLNASLVDNMPISILEALAAGVPVVTTRAGGIPDLVSHERTALLVNEGDAMDMAQQALRLLSDANLAERLREAGLNEASKYAWPRIRQKWLNAYRAAADSVKASPSAAPLPRARADQHDPD